MLATTGMRRGEALGFRWSDLDLNAGTAAIRQSLIVVNHHAQLGTPKTAMSALSVDLDTDTVSVLKGHDGELPANR